MRSTLEYVVLKYPNYYSCIIGRWGDSLYPFWYVVDNNEYVLVSYRWGEWTHKIDTTDVKDLYFLDVL